MLDFNLTEIPTSEMIVELQARGVDMSSAISQMQAERKPKKAAVAGSKILAFPRRG
jgi:hypothetical protein